MLTLYSPKSHKLNFLRSQAEQLDARLSEAWPRRTKFEQRCFELLRRAYVDARYSPHYKISPEELAWLGERVAALQGLVRQVCEERLAELAGEACDGGVGGRAWRGRARRPYPGGFSGRRGAAGALARRLTCGRRLQIVITKAQPQIIRLVDDATGGHADGRGRRRFRGPLPARL